MSIRPQLAYIVAKMAFVEGMNKSQIANKLRELGLFPRAEPNDTRGVQQLIEAAGRYFMDRSAILSDIENRNVDAGKKGPLMDKFPCLKHAIVMNNHQVASESSQPPLFTDRDVSHLYVSQMAANVVTTLINQLLDATGTGKAQDHCAISGGYSVFQTVSRMRPSTAPEAFFYPAALVAEGPRASRHISPDTNATIAWARSGALPDRLYKATLQMPILDWPTKGETIEYRHQRGKECLLEHAKTMHDYSYAGSCLKSINAFTVLVTSVDDIVPTGAERRIISDSLFPWPVDHGNASFLMDTYDINWELLAEEGVVGCMNYSLFDSDGRDRPEWRFFITPNYPNSALDFYRAVVKDYSGLIIVLGFNSASAPALKVALRAGLCNFLIIDRDTADALLQD